MSMKNYSTFPKITVTSPSDCLVSYPRRSLREGVLRLCREVVGLFYSPSRLWNMVRVTGIWFPVESYQRLKKMVFDASLFNTKHYKIQIKGRVLQYRERSCALPYTSVLLLMKREPLSRLWLPTSNVLTLYISIIRCVYILFSFFSRGIIFWIKLPLPANPVKSYARHTETLDCCFDLIRSHQQCILWSPYHWRSNQWPQIAESKLYN